jgi:hypothetical protein
LESWAGVVVVRKLHDQLVVVDRKIDRSMKLKNVKNAMSAMKHVQKIGIRGGEQLVVELHKIHQVYQQLVQMIHGLVDRMSQLEYELEVVDGGWEVHKICQVYQQFDCSNRYFQIHDEVVRK